MNKINGGRATIERRVRTATGRALAIVAVLGILAGCGSPRLAPTPNPTDALPTLVQSTAAPATPSAITAVEPCQDGKLLIGDLTAMDIAWRDGIELATAKAIEWQQDAVLSGFRVVCQLFETEFRWQATFYSRSAQAFFSSDTREVTPSGYEEEVPALSVDQLSFTLLYETLRREGFGDEIEISPSSGVDIRLNSTISPFGPPNAPKDVILYHVSIERLGEIKDVFVDGRDGTVYWYST